MSELKEIRSYIVDGFVFETKADYEAALQEKKGIKYLSSQLDLNNTEKTFQLYSELIEKKIFNTIIGLEYLKLLRQTLIKSGSYNDSELVPIRVATSGEKEKARVEKYVNKKYETTVNEYKENNKKIKSKLGTSLIFNFVLIAVIAAMIFITKNSDNPNILNYERVIQDKYSKTEQELKDREQKIRDKEWKLKEKESELQEKESELQEKESELQKENNESGKKFTDKT